MISLSSGEPLICLFAPPIRPPVPLGGPWQLCLFGDAINSIVDKYQEACKQAPAFQCPYWGETGCSGFDSVRLCSVPSGDQPANPAGVVGRSGLQRVHSSVCSALRLSGAGELATPTEDAELAAQTTPEVSLERLVPLVDYLAAWKLHYSEPLIWMWCGIRPPPYSGGSGPRVQIFFFINIIGGCLKSKKKVKNKTGPNPGPHLNYDVKTGPKPKRHKNIGACRAWAKMHGSTRGSPPRGNSFHMIKVTRRYLLAVIYYINHQGGLHSCPLYKLAHQILVLFQDKLLLLRALHVPGHLNMGADILSRQGPSGRCECLARLRWTSLRLRTHLVLSDSSSSPGAEASSVRLSSDHSAPGTSEESRGPSIPSCPILAGRNMVLRPDFPPRQLFMRDSRQEGSSFSAVSS
ncbi:Microtubule-associated serine/threonine-protein kinase 4 [Labeo rohita]|uniref:Microtubule-associated serine/threonine-protein kinase 4 n=1 Tax=Labeo rohita TaxID=84645 RepID=A0ABQ8LVM8_LABRO|nr:Microtubule-associated serine/threonine-protein kinase 4 [Labeo rohita]